MANFLHKKDNRKIYFHDHAPATSTFQFLLGWWICDCVKLHPRLNINPLPVHGRIFWGASSFRGPFEARWRHRRDLKNRFGDGKKHQLRPRPGKSIWTSFGNLGNVTLFGMVSENVTRSHKNCWWPPMIFAIERSRLETPGGIFLDKKTPIKVLIVKVCTRKTSPTYDLFWVFVWTLHFCFFFGIQSVTIYPNFTPEVCKTLQNT